MCGVQIAYGVFIWYTMSKILLKVSKPQLQNLHEWLAYLKKDRLPKIVLKTEGTDKYHISDVLASLYLKVYMNCPAVSFLFKTQYLTNRSR